MKILKHRVIKIENINSNYGLEIDIRDYKNELVLSHDHPTDDSLSLKKFLEIIPSETFLAINIKTTEIEKDLLKILKNYKIENYFTFDWAIPSLIKAIDCGLICACRLSEYEKEINPKCTWAWIDSFHKVWYDEALLTSLKEKNLKLALVSPEIHNRKNEIKKVKKIVKSGLVDAICTDFPEYWLDD